VSGSYDDKGNNIKLWDIRSRTIPIHNITGHDDKVLSVDWPSTNLILSGGADGQLRMHTWDGSEEQ